MDACPPLLLSRIQGVLEGLCRGETCNIPSAELFFNSLHIELQNGKPICGFSSLIAAANTLCEAVSIEEAIRTAKEMGRTKQGELFSAVWMAEISNHLFPGMHASVNSFLSPSAFVNVLGKEKKRLILVPYDCDKNFEPCEKEGKNAHWAVLTGFLIVKAVLGSNKISWFDSAKDVTQVEESDLFLVAFHGKSKHPAVWSYKALHASNTQLNSVDPERASQFHLPNETINEALSNKCVVLTARHK